MLSDLDWSNPYASREGAWLKGNLHGHTSPASACGEISVQDSVDLYVERGYDFIAISDHNAYTSCADERITILPGIEWNAADGSGHTGVYSLTPADLEAAIAVSDHAELLRRMAKTQAFVVLNHPNWVLNPHYRREQLGAAGAFHAVEIYNAVIERLQGYAIATDKWDYLLVGGRRILGLASDDSHRDPDIGLAAIYARSKSRSASDIMSAIRSGSLYASSGALIDDIRRQGPVIEVETPDAQEIQVRVDGGVRAARVRDRAIKLDTREVSANYVRFEVYAAGSAMAWTQPFFLEDRRDPTATESPSA